jgi:hypothetical protein
MYPREKHLQAGRELRAAPDAEGCAAFWLLPRQKKEERRSPGGGRSLFLLADRRGMPAITAPEYRRRSGRRRR